jgi:hypothetical protein
LGICHHAASVSTHARAGLLGLLDSLCDGVVADRNLAPLARLASAEGILKGKKMSELLAWLRGLFGPYDPVRKPGFRGHVPPRPFPTKDSKHE